ncbi:uncharacterized protein LOC135212210 [Macrobrachium nipponense]|uniref:uncharacterized protein LOC135212210 n=1 Tax=Macrobrachium nipponense TaxID=159736 RepID=UPI0030C7FEA2
MCTLLAPVTSNSLAVPGVLYSLVEYLWKIWPLLNAVCSRSSFRCISQPFNFTFGENSSSALTAAAAVTTPSTTKEVDHPLAEMLSVSNTPAPSTAAASTTFSISTCFSSSSSSSSSSSFPSSSPSSCRRKKQTCKKASHKKSGKALSDHSSQSLEDSSCHTPVGD